MPGAPRDLRAALPLLLPLLLLLPPPLPPCGAELRPGTARAAPARPRGAPRPLPEEAPAALRRALRRWERSLARGARSRPHEPAARRHADPPRAPWEPRAWWERPRRRRALQEEEEECGKSEGKCCLRSLKVSFQDIGWADWVVAPKSYYMRFCQGSCPHNYRAASMHAQVQARVHALARGAPAPCCVPAAYEPMVLMHYDAQGRLVSTVFEDMLVTKCHCA